MIRVAVFNAYHRHRVPKRKTSRLVRRVMKGEAVRRAMVSIIFVDSRTCRRLNRKFLGHDFVTDVLSFPLGEKRGEVEGEVYVNLDRTRQQAREYGVTMLEERSRLVVHGTLHLAGYDDDTPFAARRMRKREDWYLFGGFVRKGEKHKR
jgi:probable rRNA maturation factor